MRHSHWIAVAMALLTICPAQAKDHVYGPRPDWTRFKQLAEPAVRAQLAQPDNWAIEWPNGYIRTWWPNKGRQHGYLTCGILRAVAPINGRYPVQNFIAVVDYDRVMTIDLRNKESNSLVNLMCADLVANGRLPPAKLMEAPQEVAIERLGMTIRVMPEGAYIVAVAPDAAAARAGLVTGTVLISANGLSLTRMGSAMAKLFDSAADAIEVQTVAGQKLTITRAP